MAKIKKWIYLLLMCCCQSGWALDLVLHQADLPETIRLLCKQLHQEIILSPSVQGLVTVNFQKVTLQQALDALLISQGLDKVSMGSVWWVAPQSEMMQRHEGVAKSRLLKEQALPLEVRVWHMRYAKAKDIAAVVTSGSANLATIKVDERTNALYMRDHISSIRDMDQIIKQLDVPIPHVMVNVRLVSLDRDMEKVLGVQFATQQIRQNANSVTPSTASDANHYIFNIARLANHAALDVRLSMLESEGRAELISSPSLYAASRESASIEAGEEVPYQESSENGGTTVVFKKAVLGLQVTPQVLPGKRILLQLKINQDRPNHQMVLGVPTISTRQMVTNILAHDGETIVLGGIRELNTEVGAAGLPWLSRVPMIGWLFKRENRQHIRRDLLIFVTPSIVS